jgi:hypothetical protein
MKLDLAELQVESFASDAVAHEVGTVRGHSAESIVPYCASMKYPDGATCWNNETCEGAPGRCFPYSGEDC